MARVYRVRVRVEHCCRLGDDRGKHGTSHASQQRHPPMLVGERRLPLLLLLLLLPLLYGCSFPTTHAPPVFMPTAQRQPQHYIHLDVGVSAALRVRLLPPAYPTPAPSPCPRAALLAAAERRKGTTHGFITDGRQRWRHARARALLARLPAQQ